MSWFNKQPKPEIEVEELKDRESRDKWETMRVRELVKQFGEMQLGEYTTVHAGPLSLAAINLMRQQVEIVASTSQPHWIGRIKVDGNNYLVRRVF